jgi:hypothetical protein
MHPGTVPDPPPANPLSGFRDREEIRELVDEITGLTGGSSGAGRWSMLWGFLLVVPDPHANAEGIEKRIRDEAADFLAGNELLLSRRARELLQAIANAADQTEVESASAFIARKQREFEAELSRPRAMKDIGRRGKHHWTREAWTFMPQHNHGQKVFVLERLRFSHVEGERAYEGGAQPGDVEYRIGYWIVGRIGKRAGKWTWGQFSPMIPARDFDKLISLAREEGTVLSNAD